MRQNSLVQMKLGNASGVRGKTSAAAHLVEARWVDTDTMLIESSTRHGSKRFEAKCWLLGDGLRDKF